MKSIDSSKEGIFGISWSRDGKWLAYVQGDKQVRLANVDSGEIRDIGEGSCPFIAPEQQVVLERNDEILLISAGKEKILVSTKDISKDSSKRDPSLSPDGQTLVFTVNQVFDKESQTLNAYPMRHFLAIASPIKSKPILTKEQCYGGTTSWFPDSKHFVHGEFDSTAGPQIHVVDLMGKRLGTVAGLYPSVSPDGTRIAARPRGGGALAVYSTKSTWDNDKIELEVTTIPGVAVSKPNANPAVWLDNRLILADEGGTLWRIDTKQNKAEEAKKLPLPTERRTQSMVASPERNLIAMEVPTDDGFELRIAPIG
jgi:Tol biopolymer transport system component